MKKLMRTLKFLLLFAVLSGAEMGFAAHSQNSDNPLPCNINLLLAKQITNPWHRISSILNVLFAEYGAAGVNSATIALTTAVNEGIIAPESQYFTDAITPVGVKPAIALNVSKQLNLYSLAFENYAITLNSGGDVASALTAFNTQKKNLISALKALPKIKSKKITSLVNQYQQFEISSIQAFAIGNFPLAVKEHENAQNVVDELSAYIAKKLLINYSGKC